MPLGFFITASVGFCFASQTPKPSGPVLLDLAEKALATARANGGGSIRAAAQGDKKRNVTTEIAHDDVAEALEKGHIQPCFQPQVSTHTGQITGFEALAR